jgi:hypothetical protein
MKKWDIMQKYKIGDIVFIKSGYYSWHDSGEKKVGKICKINNGQYELFVFGTYSKEGFWGYSEGELGRKLTKMEKMNLFLEEL